MAVPSQVPIEFIAGNTWQWERELNDYPAPTWAATWYFEMAGSAFSAVATPSGAKHVASIGANLTTAFKPGRYRWKLRVTAGAESFTPEEGEILVQPDPALAGTRDTREWARRTLDAVEMALEAFAKTNIQSYTINGRNVNRAELNDLIAWRDRLRSEVLVVASKGRGRNLKVRFSRG